MRILSNKENSCLSFSQKDGLRTVRIIVALIFKRTRVLISNKKYIADARANFSEPVFS